MATLTTKFSLGDRVWKVHQTTEEIRLPCRTCRGHVYIEGKAANGELCMVKCPNCGVNATVRLGTWPEWKVAPGPLQIGMIQLTVLDRTGADNENRADNLNPARAGRMCVVDGENYMAWSTGVGSGTVHYVEDLFASREKAEEEAFARTARARAGEEPGGRKDRQSQWWPSAEQVRVAAGFLDHRDCYEHDASHIALAKVIVEVAARRPS